MNKKILAIMIAAALLQGCASYRQLESTRKEAVAEQQRAREMMSDLRTRTPVVKESSRQWINPRPVMDKTPAKPFPVVPLSFIPVRASPFSRWFSGSRKAAIFRYGSHLMY